MLYYRNNKSGIKLAICNDTAKTLLQKSLKVNHSKANLLIAEIKRGLVISLNNLESIIYSS